MFKLSTFKQLFIEEPGKKAASTAPSPDIVTLDHTPLTIAFATQTGAAESFAETTADKLQAAGIESQLLEFYDVDLALLEKTSQALFVVSTTFDGIPPDMAEPFYDEAMSAPASLEHLRYGLLALGDRVYDEFCGFGHHLDRWLQSSGAKPWFDLIEVDDEDEQDVARWMQQIETLVLAAA